MASRVPFFDMTSAFEEIAPLVTSRIEAVLAQGRYILGPECTAFEQEFADFIGVTGCVGVGNGLDALRLCLTALGIGAGDDVLVPSNTYIATWLAVSAVGARPVPVEPDEATFNISAEGISSALTPRTRAVIPVHLYGLPAAMHEIAECARANDLRVIEDACQAHGARSREQRAGSFGDLAAWSFYPAKNLGAYGDGGAVTGNDRTLIERVRLLANYGSAEKVRARGQGLQQPAGRITGGGPAGEARLSRRMERTPIQGCGKVPRWNPTPRNPASPGSIECAIGLAPVRGPQPGPRAVGPAPG